MRAYFGKLQNIISPLANKALLLFGFLACIFGPMIGFFDTYYDSEHHMLATKLFVIGEIFYTFTITFLLNKNKLHFSKSAQDSIEILVMSCLGTIVLGIAPMFNDYLGVPSLNSYVEWVVFLLCF